MDTKDSVAAISDDVQNDIENVMKNHRALHRFMTTLLDEASVSALEAFLIQDNPIILSKAASRSAHAAHKRLMLGRDHLITKEISRWESYPFEVDRPIVVSRPKKVKNGCAPQRRARRRSGLESAGEIKADILKKAEALPRAPRRRSSVRTDEVKKAHMQDELVALFEEADDSSASTISSAASTRNSSRPRRELSPHRLATPKKPMRRASELPKELTSIYHNPSAFRPSAELMDSQHSAASTESTLSELAGRHSDLSSVSENSDLLAALDLDSRSLNCSVILEEDDEREHGEEPTTNDPDKGRLKRNSSSQTNSKKPMRRVSKIPADLEPPIGGGSNHSTETSGRGRESDASFAADLPQLPVPEKLPGLDRVNSGDLDCMGVGEFSSNSSITRRSGGRQTPRKAASLPSNLSSVPKKPMRRSSEVPEDLVRDLHLQILSSAKKADEAQPSSRTESTTSETASETLGEPPSLGCSVIFEEEIEPKP